MDINEAFITAFNQAKARKEQQDNMQSLVSWLQQSTAANNAANIAPAQTSLNNFTNSMTAGGNSNPNLNALIQGAMGDNPADKQAALSLGTNLGAQGLTAVNNLDTAKQLYGTNPYDSLNGVKPAALPMILPMLMQQEQQRRANVLAISKQNQQQSWVDTLPLEKQPIGTAMIMGASPEYARLMYGSEEQKPQHVMIDTGDQITPAIFKNGKYFDTTGKEITGSFQKQVSPNTAANIQSHIYLHDNPVERPQKKKTYSVSEVQTATNDYKKAIDDIWNSDTAGERNAKITQYLPVLNSAGEVLDRDVQNDIQYITQTNPGGK